MRNKFSLKVLVALMVMAFSTGGTAEAFTLRSSISLLSLSPAQLQATVPAQQQTVSGADVFALSNFGLFSLGSVNFASIIPIASSISTTAAVPAPATQSAPPAPQSAPPAQTGTSRLTAAELDLFARLVHAEAAGEPFEGQVAVAASVLNRVRSPLYPNTLSAVINQVVNGHYQYSPVLDGRINLPANESARRAVQEALNGRDPSLGALGFFNPRKTNNQWVRSRPVTVTIGQHVFFR